MLSTVEIGLRMIELRNLRKLHTAQNIRIGLLEEQARLLKTENALLRAENGQLKSALQDITLQMEELRTMVFGRKRRREDTDDFSDTPPAQRMPRTVDSYTRHLPTDEDVTETREHPLDMCANCHGSFSEHETATYFEEDIPLPQKKVVVKHIVEKGYCPSCRKWSVAHPLPAAKVVLGENVKRYVAYLSVVCRQSYTQIQDILAHTYDFQVSQGEIAKILEKEGNRMRPEYERLKAKIRGEPSVHLDETGWNLFVKEERRYAWSMTGGASAHSVFMLGKTRGKGNADDLLGESEAVVVSDDYGAYRNMEQSHQLCLAHILRKLRDLARSKEITGTVHNQCILAYQTFASIYADIETARVSPTPATSHQALLERLQAFTTPHQRDPAKLMRVKNQVAERTECYLTCLLHPGVASDNNAAERSLRHLVIKRKTSFGSFSEKTAETLAILLSVLLSYRQRGTLGGYVRGV